MFFLSSSGVHRAPSALSGGPALRQRDQPYVPSGVSAFMRDQLVQKRQPGSVEPRRGSASAVQRSDD